MNKVILESLDMLHPLRNTPLIEIGAERRLLSTPTWLEIHPKMKIANNTYNELSTVWTETADWRADEV